MLRCRPMRLQQQLTIIKRAIPVLGNIAWQAIPNAHTTGNKTAVHRVLTELSALPYFAKTVGPMLMFHSFAVGGDDLVLDGQSYAQWNKQFGQLLPALVMMDQALALAVPQADTKTVSIRLPVTTSLTDVSKTVSDLEEILRPILEASDTETKISVQGFDTGSMWVVIALGSAAGLTIVNNICKAASKILALILDAKRTLLGMKRMGVEGAILEAVQIRAVVHQQEAMRALAEDINQQDFPDKLDLDHERAGRINRSIELLTKLNELGGEVRPAIEPISPTPKDEGFPDIAQMLDASKKELATSEQKLLSPTGDDDKTEG